MNARIVNLRTMRKRKARAAAKKTADQNAVEHGRSKAERDATRAETERVTRLHDGHRREDPDGGG